MRRTTAAVSRGILSLQQLGVDHPPPRRGGVGAAFGPLAERAPWRAGRSGCAAIVARIPPQSVGIVDGAIPGLCALGPHARTYQSHAQAARPSGRGGAAGAPFLSGKTFSGPEPQIFCRPASTTANRLEQSKSVGGGAPPRDHAQLTHYT